MSRQQQLETFVAQIARLDTDEDFNNRGHTMGCEDAVSTVDRLIGEARDLTPRYQWDDDFSVLATDNAVAFFFENAVTTVDSDDKRLQKAIALARAERCARDTGCSFEWVVDHSLEPSKRTHTTCRDYARYLCILHDQDGEVINTIRNVDFGPEANPWGNPLRRVFEATLARDGLNEVSIR